MEVSAAVIIDARGLACRLPGNRTIIFIVTESEIVQGCRRADRESQKALYALTCDRIYRLLMRMVRNTEDAADLLQNTYIRVFERVGQFKEASGLSTWVYRIAVNEALQFLRKARQHKQFIQERTSNTPDESRFNNSGALQVDLQDAMEQLPDFERILLTLKYYEGLDYAEMAKVLEKPSGTIGSGLHRARELLRQILEGGRKSANSFEEDEGVEHLILKRPAEDIT